MPITISLESAIEKRLADKKARQARVDDAQQAGINARELMRQEIRELFKDWFSSQVGIYLPDEFRLEIRDGHGGRFHAIYFIGAGESTAIKLQNRIYVDARGELGVEFPDALDWDAYKNGNMKRAEDFVEAAAWLAQ